MATLLFSAAGAALGSGFGGTMLGLSGAVIGRAAGATLGRAVDQRILSGGAEAFEVGRIDRLQIMGASQGAPVAQMWGRMRMPGQVIWASKFKENRTRSGGKGLPSPKVTQLSYTVSLAISLCEGEILGVGRIWADGNEVQQSSLSMRVYNGTEDQLPDSAIEAEEGVSFAPAYRGIAYVVFESLDLSVYGNRIPQFSFEVSRRAKSQDESSVNDFQDAIRAVALIPGTGEYAYAVEKQSLSEEFGLQRTVNVNSQSGYTDFTTSMNQLNLELPNCGAVSLVISWFGDDLRCGSCKVQPKVEQSVFDSQRNPWRSGGIDRNRAQEIAQIAGRPVYGGTPGDDSVVSAIREMNQRGLEIMFYPFVLMDQIEGNTLFNPYTGGLGQPALPWRGRITLSSAPGMLWSPDGTAQAVQEVSAFFGNARVENFITSETGISFDGEPDWGYRHFILHYAHLCKFAGDIESFCIGSELRGLSTIRGPNNTYPAVEQLIRLLEDVRVILGEGVKLSYAADWSEFFGHHFGESVQFHLDPLWAHPDVDFVGIDYYMPLSDWRDSPDHLDAGWLSEYSLEYIQSNIYGGEGFDWYYSDSEAEKNQVRTGILDSAFSESWIFRPKDLISWWSKLHFNRTEGVRSGLPTDWLPQSKPYRFTEFGCAALNKGANQPNKFLDSMSSESSLPRGSSGARDDLIQMQFYRAFCGFWNSEERNPSSSIYAGRMLDQRHCYAWAWDVRPYPDFPRSVDIWSDGGNYYQGHWLNGRSTSVPLDLLLGEVCAESGVSNFRRDQVFGAVKGYSVGSTSSARDKIQSLMQIFSFECTELSGDIAFFSRGVFPDFQVNGSDFVDNSQQFGGIERIRVSENGTFDCIRLTYLESDASFAVAVAEVSDGSSKRLNSLEIETSVMLSRFEAYTIVSRLLAEQRSAQNQIVFHAPPSMVGIAPGSFVEFDGTSYRVNSVEFDGISKVQAVEMDRSFYQGGAFEVDDVGWTPSLTDSPIHSIFLELPPFRSQHSAIAPFVAVSSVSYPSPAVLWSSPYDSDYEVNTVFSSRSWIGRTESPLQRSGSGRLDRGDELLVRMPNAPLSSVSLIQVLGGRNLVAIGDGSSKNWEIFQFQEANVLSSGLWSLKTRLRGQFGTDIYVQETWPAGSIVVFLDEGLVQAQLFDEHRGVQQHYRVGSERSGLDDINTSYSVRTFQGAGLVSPRVCHFKVVESELNSHNFSWVRCSRLEGDSWDGYESPFNEKEEQYSVDIFSVDGLPVRQIVVSASAFEYSSSMRLSDGTLGGYLIEVCQMSLSVGKGHKASLFVS